MSPTAVTHAFLWNFFSLCCLDESRPHRHRPAVNIFLSQLSHNGYRSNHNKKSPPLYKLSKHIIQVPLPVNESWAWQWTPHFLDSGWAFYTLCWPVSGIYQVRLTLDVVGNTPSATAATLGSSPYSGKHGNDILLGFSGLLAQLRSCQSQAELQVMLQ